MSAPAVFGLDPFWLSLALLLATYAVLTLDRINRAIVALIGATLMLLAGVVDQDRAVAGQDFNTLALLIGMMLLVGIARPSGMFQYLAFWSARVAKPITEEKFVAVSPRPCRPNTTGTGRPDSAASGTCM